MSKFKPVIVLAAISAIVAALVIITYNITYVDTSGILTEKQSAAAVEIFGGAAEDYSVVPASEWQPLLLTEDDSDLSRIVKVIRKTDGSLAFEVVVKGYKEGYDLLVGVSDGAVAGVSVISTGEETPKLGTRTAERSFLDLFRGISGRAVIVKNQPSAEGEVQAVTGATLSSKGVAKAVNIALEGYSRMNGGGAE